MPSGPKLPVQMPAPKPSPEDRMASPSKPDGAPHMPPPKPAGEPSPSAQEQEDDEDATVVSAVPPEILEASATGSHAAVEEAGEIADWHNTFEEFLRTKKQCGEPTTGLTFEKFQTTLRKNRDQLMAKTKCKRVKFTVYVKDGRAALKASPVR